MEQYISKDAVLAEIERRLEAIANASNENNRELAAIQGAQQYELINLIQFLDTLEVKEDNLLTEKKIEKELAEIYISIFDKKFGNKLPKLKGKQLAEFKNFINTCEQTFHIKYFDYHATQGKLFEKLALLWAVWGKEHLKDKTE